MMVMASSRNKKSNHFSTFSLAWKMTSKADHILSMWYSGPIRHLPTTWAQYLFCKILFIRYEVTLMSWFLIKINSLYLDLTTLNFLSFLERNIKTERLKLNKLAKKKWCGLCCGLYVILISNLIFGNLKENLKTKYKEGKVVYSQSK